MKNKMRTPEEEEEEQIVKRFLDGESVVKLANEMEID